jgi:chromosome segregation ATPase
MARAGVTFTDIAKAAEKIKTQGQEPTVDRVREQLGTGSKSTIAPLLKKWKNNYLNNDNGTDIPNELLEVVKSLYESTQALADIKIKQAKEECDLKLKELRGKLKESTEFNLSQSSKIEILEMKLSKYKDSDKLLNKEIENQNIEKFKNKYSLEKNKSQIDELKSTITELKNENKDIREHFEHYQQHTANDRQLEREQFLLTNQQLNDQIQSKSNQISEVENQINLLQNQLTENQKTIGNSNTKNKEITIHLNSMEIEAKVLNEKYDQTLSLNSKLNLQNNEFKEKINLITIENSVMIKEVEMLNKNLNNTQSKLDKVKYDIKENTTALTTALLEKSVLQGQLKQVHDSLSKN